MKITKPICPACEKTIFFLEIEKDFSCPHCGRRLKSSGQENILIFEVVAFFVLGAPLAIFFSLELYLGVVAVLVVWVGMEFVVRNSMLRLSMDSDDASNPANLS
ncbi:MAG: hypothetical protein IPH30_16540 [Betaproteobacteria bacterium]|nr:hypothetical protein [Betaproteobacteria bacterium]